MAQTTTRMAAKVPGSMALILVLAVTGLSACGRASAGITTGVDSKPGSSSTKVNPMISEVYKEDQPTFAVADPAEGPVNLPPIPRAPTTAVEPTAMIVRAIAETCTNMPAPGLGNLKTIIIRAKVTWTPIKGAAGYKVYQLAAREGLAADDKGKLMMSTPTWLPLAIVGGGFNLMNLNVGQEYVYTVEALDRAGNVIARGQDNCAPLAPLEIPYLKEPTQNEGHVGQTPYFKWTESRGADGYYIEVFGTIRSTIPVLPMWRGFRSNPESMNIMYGQQVDVFEGTRPMQWAIPLNIASRYAWTVCALRTDTHNMQNAKAIARATAPLNFFVP